MKPSKLKTEARQRCRRLEKKALRMRSGFDGEDVHALRLEFKRLRALLELLDSELPGLELPRQFDFLKKKYRRLGRLREADLLAARLKNSKRLSPERRKAVRKAIEKQRRRAEKRLTPRFFKKTARAVRDLEEQLLAAAEAYPPAAFEKWMTERAALLRATDPEKLRSEAESHEFRRQLKTFLYNLDLPGKRERLALEKSAPLPPDADDLQRRLGERHDRAMWRRFLAG